jgi:hypothetical protein
MNRSQIYTIRPAGFRTILSDGTSDFTSNTTYSRPQVFAGSDSSGLVVSSAARPLSIQFGTTAAESLADTAYTATSAEMESGTIPELVTVEANGNHSVGYGRIIWNTNTKHLRMEQRAGDALLSNNPRVQIYSYPLLQKTTYYTVYLSFKLGDDATPWARVISNKNSTLIWQLKGGASFPPLTVEIYDPTNGDPACFDLVFLQRIENSSPQTELYRVSNCLKEKYHECKLVFLLDSLSQSAGGRAYTAFYYNHILSYEATTLNIYPLTPDGDLSCMWGIYRYRYIGEKAPDNSCIIFTNAKIEANSDLPIFTSSRGVR